MAARLRKLLRRDQTLAPQHAALLQDAATVHDHVVTHRVSSSEKVRSQVKGTQKVLDQFFTLTFGLNQTVSLKRLFRFITESLNIKT